ncbi:hypothetical protein BT93_L3007 [Corymbia citriodora subsp. variegata]|uniref:Proteinase inhibitor n=1 Tax=Corymbia citriodora subsp. variegata TaxID=360336 RepID=A0A8T0CJI7_CORYI|nr:hypothetical protein BT93_L3007 [Corymbia citriodora subsp. variegata]
MSSITRRSYPPCDGSAGPCIGPDGKPAVWPDLVGQNGEKAKAVIEKDNKRVTVVLIKYGKEKGFTDHCCNRVYLWIDEKGNVCQTPMAG